MTATAPTTDIVRAQCQVVDPTTGADDHRPDDNRDVVARGMCWRHLQRDYRGQPLVAQPDPDRTQLLAGLLAAHRRVGVVDARVDPAMATLRARAQIAYAAGLSQAQIGQIVGRGVPAVQKWIPAGTARPQGAQPGSFGGARAPDQVVQTWAPTLKEAADTVAEIHSQAREARRQRAELVAAAMADGTPGRVGIERVADHLGVAVSTVQEWLHGPRPRNAKDRTPRTRCAGIRAAGGRCRADARVGHRTCWHHRTQE